MEIEAGYVLASRYRADQLLGRGGMGEVWRAFDLEEERDVAVKTVLAEHLGDPRVRRLFQAEVIAVAKLSHPGIVEVYDLLQLDDGSSLLVMGYRPGKSLDHALKATPSWPLVRRVLAQLCEALAHAHARSVLHLDIKPANVIVERKGDAVRTTLVDFGIARVKRPGRGAERWFERDALVGTLEYMAPEQCCGELEKLGPWTDLYSLGMLLYELCAGAPPHGDTDPVSSMRLRLEHPAPPLRPRVHELPPGVAELCSRLLAIEPRDRPWCAADVLAELELIDPKIEGQPGELRGLSSGPPASSDMPDPSSAPTIHLGSDVAPTLVARERVGALLAELDREERASQWPVPSSRDVPSSNKRRAGAVQKAFTADVTPPTPGAYGLFGLRELPVFGRVEERRALWNAVGATALDARPSAVVLSGPAGTGKSRLARDAVERALEIGLCAVLHTHWSADGSADEGLRGMVENALETRGASGEELVKRLAFWLERMPVDHEAFVREATVLLRPEHDAAPDAGLPVRVAVDLVVRAAMLRPLLVWLDDVQWSRGEAAALVRALAALRPVPAVCVLCTIREEEDFDDRELLAALEQLGEADGDGFGVVRVSMRPLGDEAARTLVRGLLDLDEELVARLVRRSEGNPLFATQLVRQLVLERAVRRHEGHYVLAGDMDVDTVLPGDIGAVWGRRIALAGASERDLQALAVVRDRVSTEVAGALALLAGPTFGHSIGRALAAGLLERTGEAYAWTHGLLRDFLVGRVEPKRVAVVHAWAAEALELLVGREDVQEERAHHLWRAEKQAEACEAMLDAAMWSWRRAERDARLRRLASLREWVDPNRLDLSVRAHAEIAHAHAEGGDFHDANSSLERIAAQLGNSGGKDGCWSWFRRAQTLRLQGRRDEGAESNQRAVTLARSSNELEVEALSLTQLALDAYRTGRSEEARALFETASAVAHQSHNRTTEAQVMLQQSALYDVEAREATLRRAADIARAAGALRVELMAKQCWIDALWASGEHSRAIEEATALSAQAARRALRQTVSLVELQAACWAVEDDDWDAASRHRAAAAQWGASSGAVPERATLAALDLLLALVRGEANVAGAADRVVAEGTGYNEQMFRDLVARAADLAPPTLATRLRSL
jgi:serine/threonine protein kinase